MPARGRVEVARKSGELLKADLAESAVKEARELRLLYSGYPCRFGLSAELLNELIDRLG
ncbi:MAG TPA: hypothetical protein VN706_03055 [Gemmatimonadaceae bacterium]|nr:hypothetical protein [Gemmatimonadaceae bacterium]